MVGMSLGRALPSEGRVSPVDLLEALHHQVYRECGKKGEMSSFGLVRAAKIDPAYLREE